MKRSNPVKSLPFDPIASSGPVHVCLDESGLLIVPRPMTRREQSLAAPAASPERAQASASERRAVQRALTIMERYLVQAPVFLGPWDVKEYVRLQIGAESIEVFAAMYLTPQKSLLAFEIVARGTTTQCPVFLREIARRGIELDASAVILAHNHPSGRVDPSESDIALTRYLKDGLAALEIKVHDHVIVSRLGTTSLAERGLV